MNLLLVSVVAVVAIMSMSIITFNAIKMILLDDINLANKINTDSKFVHL